MRRLNIGVVLETILRIGYVRFQLAGICIGGNPISGKAIQKINAGNAQNLSGKARGNFSHFVKFY